MLHFASILRFIYIIFILSQFKSSDCFYISKVSYTGRFIIMVNSVSNYNPNMAFYRAAASTAALHQNDVENMVKFLNGQPINTVAEPTIGETIKGTIPFLGLFGGFEIYSTMKNNGLVGAQRDAFRIARKNTSARGWNLSETIKNVNSRYNYTRSQALQAAKDKIAKDYGNFFKKSVTVDTHRRKLGRVLDKLPGYKKLRASGFGQAMGKSGAGWMAVMEGGVEMFTQVVPAFQQGGASAGFKQLAKSGTKVAASTGGFLAGDVVGKGIGAAIGTFICPGVGTAIGGFIGGFLGGICGSAVASKVAKKITGPSELEKIQNNQVAQTSQQIENDPQTKLALAQQTLAYAEQTLAVDPENKDALAARDAANNVIDELTNTANINSVSNTQTQQANVMPNVQTNVYSQNAGIPVVPGFNGMGYDMNQYSQFASNSVSTNPFAVNTLNN